MRDRITYLGSSFLDSDRILYNSKFVGKLSVLRAHQVGRVDLCAMIRGLDIRLDCFVGSNPGKTGRTVSGRFGRGYILWVIYLMWRVEREESFCWTALALNLCSASFSNCWSWTSESSSSAMVLCIGFFAGKIDA